MSDRDAMIAAEAERQKDYEKRRAELTKEFDKIAGPVLEFRRIEERMTQIQNQLQNESHHSSATRAQFRRDLETALPPELLHMRHAAKAELGQRHSDASALAIDRLAALRRWLDEVDASRGRPEVTTADLEALAERGRDLNLTGRARAFDDPQAVRA